MVQSTGAEGGEYSTKINIRTSDGEVIEASMNLVGMCGVLKDAFEGTEHEEEHEEIKLEGVDKKNL